MKSRKDEIYDFLCQNQTEQSASEIADAMNLDRTNVSRYLNELVKDDLVKKINTRPVKYQTLATSNRNNRLTFDNLIGSNESLKLPIQKAKAAVLYPPRGLHTIIFGKTGTGKTLFAECMYNFAVDANMLSNNAPFVSFNCADYAQNPQLLFAHIFGVKKGAFTGADEDRDGLVKQADGGILFLDEIHRLPPEGQEMLFTFIDKGVFRPLGASDEVNQASVQIIGATTEQSSMFLDTFNRRIPMSIELPAVLDRSFDERYEIVTNFLQQEANRLQQSIVIEKDSLLSFMLYTPEGNIGQIKRDLKLVCAKAFLHYRTHKDEQNLKILQADLPLQVQKGFLKIKSLPEKMEPLRSNPNKYLTFTPGTSDVVWSKDPAQDMAVYNSIIDKVERLNRDDLQDIDLENLISTDMEQYFETYVEELSQTTAYRDLISDDLWQLTQELYTLASSKLGKVYDDNLHFAFALHIQSTVERIRHQKVIIHPNLNEIRKQHSKEFQVAIELSDRIEDFYKIIIPMDEIGFITMFLSAD